MLFGSVVEALNVEPAGKKNTRSINFQIVVITRKPWWECQQGGRIGQQKRRNHDQTKEDYFDLPIPRKKNNESPTPFTL